MVCRVQVFFASRVYLGMPISYAPGDLFLDYDGCLAVNNTVHVLPLGRTAPTLVVGNS